MGDAGLLSPRPAVTGVILAGGLGRRMDGVDKGLQRLRGLPLALHVAARLGPQVDALLINANRNADDYAALGHRVIADALTGFPGPLAGLHAALGSAGTPLVVTAPCDSPFLPEDLVARLLAALQASGRGAAVAVAAGKMQPVFCLCRCTQLADLTAYLAAGGRRMGEWLDRIGAARADFGAASDAFANINTHAELDRLRGGAGGD